MVHAALQLASLEPEGCALTGSSWAASRYVYTAGPVSSRQLSLHRGYGLSTLSIPRFRDDLQCGDVKLRLVPLACLNGGRFQMYALPPVAVSGVLDRLRAPVTVTGRRVRYLCRFFTLWAIADASPTLVGFIWRSYRVPAGHVRRVHPICGWCATGVMCS